MRSQSSRVVHAIAPLVAMLSVATLPAGAQSAGVTQLRGAYINAELRITEELTIAPSRCANTGTPAILANIWNNGRQPLADSAYLLRVLDLVGDHIIPPVGVQHPFAGAIGFAVDRSGRIDRIQVLAPSRFQQLDSAMLRAVRVTEDLGGVDPLPPEFGAEWLLVGLGYGTEGRGPGQRRAVLALARPDKPAYFAPDSPHPRYPGSSRNRAGGEATVAAIIDETGRAIPGSARVVSATSPEFGRSVMRGVAHMRFLPAMVGNCPVKQFRHIRFTFGPTSPTS